MAEYTGSHEPRGPAKPIGWSDDGHPMGGTDGLPADYEALRALGEGTSAVVYLCRERATGREVAIKAFRGRLVDRGAAQRFRAEANIMAMLRGHPHILTVHRADITPNGLAYLVLEYAPNGSIRQLMRNRRLTERHMLDVGIAVAGALATAHRRGIVHRDVKPGNILITRRGLPALADFGVAAGVYEHAATGFSTPWAAPELLTGESGGNESSDLYSLAATMFAMLTGRSPYEYAYAPRTNDELAQAIVFRPPPVVERSVASPCVASLLTRALSKIPAERPYSAVEFARDMQLAQHRLGFEVTPLTVDGVAPYPARMGGAGSPPRMEDGERPASAHATVPRSHGSIRRRAVAGAAAVIVAAIVMGAMVLAMWRFGDAIPSETGIQVAFGTVRTVACEQLVG